MAQRARCGGTGWNLLVPAGLCSGESVCSPSSRPQKEEAIEQPEFKYDEFGFRVDKEGKASPIPPHPSPFGNGDVSSSQAMQREGRACLHRALRHLEL